MKKIAKSGRRICPFMSRQVHNNTEKALHFIRCTEDKCMAWQPGKTYTVKERSTYSGVEKARVVTISGRCKLIPEEVNDAGRE